MGGRTLTSYDVNNELKEEASKVLYDAAKQTWKTRSGRLGEIVEVFEDFTGLRAVNVGGLPEDTYMGIGFDGIGSKVELAERTLKHYTVGHDLLAMVCDDALVRGAEPVLVGSILDVRRLGKGNLSYIDFVKQLAIGYVNAALAANVAVINGEVAELGARIRGYDKLNRFNYNWGAAVVWFARKNRMLTGREIKEGDKLVILRENGFRSNGLSLVRRILYTKYGEEWHRENYNGQNLGGLALIPSRIYTRAVVDMIGGFEGEPKAEVHGISHVTGGGIPEKLHRVLKPSNLGAYLDDPFDPCDLMKHCQEVGDVTDKKAYRTWNMGQGMIVITPNPDTVMKIAGQYEIESKVGGEITKEPGIRIRNKGINSDKQKELVF